MSTTEKQIANVVENILQDYKSGRDIDRIERLRRPDRDEVVDIIEKLRRIVFPGYFRNKSHRYYNETSELCVLIEDAIYRLTRQIRLVLQQKGQTEEQAAENAQTICIAFFESIPQIRAVVQTDLQAAYDGDPAATGMAEIIFSYPGLFAITVYRLAHVLYELGVPMLPRIMTEHAHSVTGIDIHPGATIGEYFFIDHGTGVVIGETSVIGRGCRLYQGVTLGALSFPKNADGTLTKGIARHPLLEDCVTVYAGATILGRVTIGKGAVIGGNVWITSDVPAGARISQERPHA